jgi:hypothetical protein
MAAIRRLTEAVECPPPARVAKAQRAAARKEVKKQIRAAAEREEKKRLRSLEEERAYDDILDLLAQAEEERGYKEDVEHKMKDVAKLAAELGRRRQDRTENVLARARQRLAKLLRNKPADAEEAKAWQECVWMVREGIDYEIHNNVLPRLQTISDDEIKGRFAAALAKERQEAAEEGRRVRSGSYIQEREANKIRWQLSRVPEVRGSFAEKAWPRVWDPRHRVHGYQCDE